METSNSIDFMEFDEYDDTYVVTNNMKLMDLENDIILLRNVNKDLYDLVNNQQDNIELFTYNINNTKNNINNGKLLIDDGNKINNKIETTIYVSRAVMIGSLFSLVGGVKIGIIACIVSFLFR